MAAFPAIYGKGERADLSPEDRKAVSAFAGRAKALAKKESEPMGTIAQDLLESMEFMADHLGGKAAEGKVHQVEIVDDLDVRSIRQSLHMTQEAFAEAFRLDVASVRAWEQKRRRPEKAARLYLKVIAKNPQAVRDAIAA